MFGKKYLLRSLDANLNALAPGDKILILAEGKNATGADNHSVDLSKMLNSTADLYYFQFKKTTLSNGAFTSDGSVAGNNEDVLTVVICDAEQLKIVGG